MLLADLDLTALEEKSAPDRWGKDDPELDRRTFFDPQRQLYFKVWGSMYSAHRRFISGNGAWAADIRTVFGFEVGFFSAENCAALLEFIHDGDGFVRGYVTRAGQPLLDTENALMDRFLDETKKATERSGFVHNDVCYNNLILVGDRISFIDFDTVFSDLERLDVPFESKWGALRPHVLSEYSEFVTGLVAKRKQAPVPLKDHLTVQGRQIPVYLEGHIIGGLFRPVCDEDENTAYESTEFFEETFVPHAGWFTHHARDPIAAALREGHFESVEQAFCWLFLREGDTFLDCGSRVGVFAVLAGRAMNNTGRVIAAEGNPKYTELFRGNVQGNGVAIVETPISVPSVGAACGDCKLSAWIEPMNVSRVELARIERGRPWVHLLDDPADGIWRARLPLLMFTSPESGAKAADESEAAFFEKLTAAGYVLACLDRHGLRLVAAAPGTRHAGKTLFAALDLKAANSRLAAAGGGRLRIARDVIRRGGTGERIRDLKLLDELKLRAGESEKLRKWAQEVEANLKIEKQVSAEFRSWADRAQAELDQERKTTQELREWTENAEAKLIEERKLSRQLREWAENAEAKLIEERKLSRQLREWAESAEARVASHAAQQNPEPATEQTPQK